MTRAVRRLAPAALLLAVAACVAPSRRPVTPPPPVVSVPRPSPVQPAPPPPSAPVNAVEAGVRPAPLPTFSTGEAAAAIVAFRATCPALLRRADRSGLTQPGDWRAACDAAATASDPVAFFTGQFSAVRVGEGRAFLTGYYEPEIEGSRERRDGYAVPIYRRPPDLVERQLAVCPDVQPVGAACPLRTRRGRLVEGAFVPYHDRAAIEDGALAGRGLELAWAADPVEMFFLEVQGSGRLRLPDGQIMRIGYAGQNGHAYTGIGALMRQRGLLGPGQTSMQGIVAWLRANPEEGRAIMRENRSFVFFRELTTGAVGALGVPVTGRVTVAADPAFVPLGAPVWLAVDHPEVGALWVAQDTGGAIKGANRFDTFWGAGSEARRIAGGMQARGEALILLPRAAAARLTRGATGRP